MSRRPIVMAFRRLAHVTSGQDLMEYALLAALIVVVAIAGVGALGNTIKTVFWDAIADFKL